MRRDNVIELFPHDGVCECSQTVESALEDFVSYYRSDLTQGERDFLMDVVYAMATGLRLPRSRRWIG